MSKETSDFVKKIMEKKDSEAKQKLKEILMKKVAYKLETTKD